MNRKLIIGVVVGLLAAQVWAQDKPAGKKVELKGTMDKAAYAIGFGAGRSIRNSIDGQSLDFDQEVVIKAFRDALAGGKSQLTDEEVQATMQALQKEISERNAQDGEAFLAANKKKKDVTTLPSGLQYKVLKKGTGKKPTVKDGVIVNYRGKLINGKEFDSSYQRKQPLTIGVTQVIPGWVEALQLMETGSKWELYIPAELAYGPEGSEVIGPNSTLIFEIELVDIAKQKPAQPGFGPPKNGGAQQPAEEIEN